jgi:hypothetical protein
MSSIFVPDFNFFPVQVADSAKTEPILQVCSSSHRFSTTALEPLNTFHVPNQLRGCAFLPGQGHENSPLDICPRK